MKIKLSIAIDEKLLNEIDKYVESGLFRSRSHAVDFSLNVYRGVRNG